jgi:hypothetical protein
VAVIKVEGNEVEVREKKDRYDHAFGAKRCCRGGYPAWRCVALLKVSLALSSNSPGTVNLPTNVNAKPIPTAKFEISSCELVRIFGTAGTYFLPLVPCRPGQQAGNTSPKTFSLVIIIQPDEEIHEMIGSTRIFQLKVVECLPRVTHFLLLFPLRLCDHKSVRTNNVRD